MNKFWIHYASVTDAVSDCSSLKGDCLVRIGGRLRAENKSWFLSSGGTEIPIKFAPSTNWFADSLRESCEFSSDVLSHNDIVLVEGIVSKDEKEISCTSISLLVPTQDSNFTVEFSIQQARKWSDFVQATRKFFYDHDFLEARTPTLVPSPGTEPFLDAFSTETMFESATKRMFLPTSPEFHLKKLLVAGFTKIFELKDCFRNNERGEHHQPEFLMLEWYRAYSNLSRIEDDCSALLGNLSEKFIGKRVGLQKTTVRELFEQILGFKLTPQTTKQELIALAEKHKVLIGADDSWDDIYFRIFLEKIESHLNQENPILLSDYPPSQAALARINEAGWADRFEIYWRGYEIANAFHELNDPQANIDRFAKDAIDARQLGKAPVPHDTELVEALKKGMPPSGGIALGMDRLFMALTCARTIGETRAFAFRHNS